MAKPKKPLLEGTGKVDVTRLADPALMRKIWQKRIRKSLRTSRFQDFELAHDPLEHLAFDWDLDATLATLCAELRDGHYRAGAPEIVRSAKGSGLTRPLAFIAARDLIVYKTVIATAENALLAAIAPWARFGRADDGDAGESFGESGWFRSWLRRQGQLWTITENHAWLVETDVANFFPYVALPSVLNHVLANSNLGEDAARILEHLLKQFAPMDHYRQSPVVGLPQDNFDCSRILGHTYLKPVDDAFRSEGEANQYSRWMDDIVVGAETKEAALGIVARLQGSLERLGLYPNTAKTRIVRASDFLLDYMKDENDFLGEVDDRWRAKTPEDMTAFKTRLRRHLGRKAPRPKAWARVLRRYYTACRHLESDALVSHAFEHIYESPDSARTIFEYLSTYPLTATRVDALIELLKRLRGVYPDIEILAQEYLCVAPNSKSETLAEAISNWAIEVMEREWSSNPRLAAAACLTVGKFGNDLHIGKVQTGMGTPRLPDTVFRQQALIVLAARGRVSSSELGNLSPHSSLISSQHVRFLRALFDGEAKAVNMTLSLLEPVKRTGPTRLVIRPRVLLLGSIIGKSAPDKVSTVRPKWAKLLKTQRRSMRDFTAERMLGI